MITVSVDGRSASLKSTEPITSGSVGIPVKFELSEDFDGLSSIAVFEGSGTTVDVALMSNTCEAPPEVLAAAGGCLRIGVYARNSEGTIIIPTIWVSTRPIEKGAEPSGVDPSQPTPDWTAQVQAAAAEAMRKAGEAEAAAITAQDSASASAEAARTARQDAETAQGKAESARQGAETAQDKAESAQQAAESARGRAESAGQSAEAARSAAAAAAQAAENASGDAAESAEEAARSASGALASAQAATDASGAAIAAGNASKAAKDAAESAQHAAEAAQGRAESAKRAAETAEGEAETAREAAEEARDTSREYRDEVVETAEGIAQQTTAEDIAAMVRAISGNLEELVEINRSIRYYDTLPEEGTEGYTYITPDGVYHYATGEYIQVSGSGDLNGFSLSLDVGGRVLLSYVNPEDETDTAEAVMPTDTTGQEILSALRSTTEALRIWASKPSTTEG